jgi:hypothetical protein
MGVMGVMGVMLFCLYPMQKNDKDQSILMEEPQEYGDYQEVENLRIKLNTLLKKWIVRT